MQSIREFWEDTHRQKTIGPLPLTSYSRIYRLYHLHRFVAPGRAVLEVGVGLGRCVEGLRDAGCAVYALDISRTALEGVSRHIERGYTVDDVAEMPSGFFDLVLCHLVAQHMSDAAILAEFSEVIRALKRGGIFIVQFSASRFPERNNVRESVVGERWENGAASEISGGICRTPDYATHLIESCGGEVLRMNMLEEWPEHNSYWFSLEITRRLGAA